MQSIFKRISLSVLYLAISLPLAGQSVLSLQKPAAAAEPAPSDPLGRETPSGSVFGFLQAAQAGNYKKAAEYLQMTVAQRRTDGEERAEQLKVVMDQGFVGNLKRITTNPEGTPQEGLPLNQMKVGTLAIGDVETDLLLVRVVDAAQARVWLISSETLSRVPELSSEIHVSQFEKLLPQVMVQKQFLGMPLWQWLAELIAIPISALLGWLCVRVFLLPQRMWAQYRKQPVLAERSAVSGPAWVIVATIMDIIITRLIGTPLLHRHYYLRITSIVLIIGFTWLLLRLTGRLTLRWRDRNFRSGRRGAVSILLLGERILKAIVIVLAGFAILGSLGFDMSTALAGLGIGGIAIALAAQKTLENLFGGVSVLGDEVIRVGDVCQFGDRVGTVEDVSLRSTRIRTTERTELSIPNGLLATINVENLSRRDKTLFNTKFGLRSETASDQLRYLLAEARRMLYEHPKVESESARIRFVEFQDRAFGLEVFCYILTRDAGEFNAIREDLLFRIMEIVEQAGTSFASQSQIIYLTRDNGLDQEKTEAALQQVQKWRDERQIPFPDFAAADIAKFRDTIAYPEPDSSLARRD
jgi:MscS family membrane protein